jgi:polysaccharide export outer membrane protein
VTRRTIGNLVSLVAFVLCSAGLFAQSEPARDNNYSIGPGDRLRIALWNQANVSGEYAVDGDGAFTFPLIGRVVANGLTTSALEAELRRRLGDGFYRNPQVTVAVVEYRSQRFYVMGSVRNPGTHPLTGAMTLIEALTRAGSTTGDAADQLLILRSPHAQGPVLPGQDAGASVIRVDLRQLSGGQPTDVSLQDGDTIYVPRASTIYVYGEVRRPGNYPIPDGTTIRQVLSLAGGLTEFGADNRIHILRLVKGKEMEMKVKLNDKVESGDTVVVPQRYF